MALNSPLNGMVSVCYALQLNAISNTFSLSVFVLGEVSVCVENGEPHCPAVHINAPDQGLQRRLNGTSQLNANTTQRAHSSNVHVHVHALYLTRAAVHLHTETLVWSSSFTDKALKHTLFS